MKTITIETYEYSELDAAAQGKARDWYREASAGDSYFAEHVIDDAKTIGALMGITITSVPWSGFGSQGDGACFEGTWAASNVEPGKVKEYAPQDSELHRIAAEFEQMAKALPVGHFAVTHRGRHCHKYETEFSFDWNESEGEVPESMLDKAEGELTETARDFMGWIYRQLEAAYEYEVSDEGVTESIIANEYLFTKDGKRSVTL